MTHPRLSSRDEPSEAPENPWAPPSGPLALLTTISNQELGKLFMGTAALFFLLGGLMALLMRTQLAVPENGLLDPETYNRLFTMHGSTMMYLVVVPFLEGLAIYLLPLLVGSRDVAYPYITAFSYWTYLFGGIAFYASFLLGDVPDVGWFAYAPLSGAKYSGAGSDFWSLTTTLISLGDLSAGLGLTVTVLKLRAPGMTLGRMPLFAWAWLVTGVMFAFAFTTLLVITTIMLPLDRSLGTHFFDPERGGSPLLWQHLFWFFGHPEVYLMFIPATGIVSSILPVFARRPIAGYALIATAIVVTGFVSFGLWVHHMFTTGIPWLSQSFFTAASLTIALASGTQVFAWIATLWGSRPRLRTPLLYCLGFLFLFVLGGLTGVMVAIVPFDLQVHDSYFVVAHFHYVLIGGVLFPALGGMAYWLPKITGRLLNERLGRWSFWLIFLGFNVAFFPMHLTGLLGMPRRVYTYPPELGVGGLNLISTAGAGVLAAGIALFVVDFLLSLRRGPRASRDPWGGDTLEWSLDSPPPPDSFRVPPRVRSRHPRWEPLCAEPEEPCTERVRRSLAALPPGWRVALVTSLLDAKPEALQPWPRPSLLPFAASVGVTILLLGALAKSGAAMLLGAGLTVFAVLLWYQPEDRLLETLRATRIEERSGLPLTVSGPANLDWWGLLCWIVIFATVYAIFFYSYFYLRLYSPLWPQDHLPRPDLRLGAAFALLGASALWQAGALRSFRAGKTGRAAFGLAAAMAAGLLFLALLGLSQARSGFAPQANAYASIFHVLHWLLELTVAAALVTNGAAQLRLWREGCDPTRYVALQVERATTVWVCAVLAALLVYAVVYVSPYL